MSQKQTEMEPEMDNCAICSPQEYLRPVATHLGDNRTPIPAGEGLRPQMGCPRPKGESLRVNPARGWPPWCKLRREELRVPGSLELFRTCQSLLTKRRSKPRPASKGAGQSPHQNIQPCTPEPTSNLIPRRGRRVQQGAGPCSTGEKAYSPLHNHFKYKLTSGLWILIWHQVLQH